jgi:hypothetical protein
VLTAGALLACHRLDLEPRLWTAWGRDWEASATPSSIVRTATRALAGGGTLLLHDSDCTSAAGSWRRTLAALPRIIDWAHDRNLRLVPLRDHHRRSSVRSSNRSSSDGRAAHPPGRLRPGGSISATPSGPLMHRFNPSGTRG